VKTIQQFYKDNLVHDLEVMVKEKMVKKEEQIITAALEKRILAELEEDNEGKQEKDRLTLEKTVPFHYSSPFLLSCYFPLPSPFDSLQ